ncbi:class III signal peptide-containing protein [archaeon]|nr:class III signal peptide-containing protein [archaeon]
MQKGQGALEYLLLIGGAVLVAVIVITVVLGIADKGEASTESASTAGSGIMEQTRNKVLGLGSGTAYKFEMGCVRKTGSTVYIFDISEATAGSTLKKLSIRSGNCRGDNINLLGDGFELSGGINKECDGYAFTATPPFTITNQSLTYDVDFYVGTGTGGGTLVTGPGGSIVIAESQIGGLEPPSWEVGNGKGDACIIYATAVLP